MLVSDLFSPKLLETDMSKGLIRVGHHPTLPLSIYNYTQKVQFESAWDEATLQCRGLVLDDKGEVVIRCVPKFFNREEPLAAKIDWEHCEILSKLDGYYIAIKLSLDYGLVLSSRGSFDNQYVNAARVYLNSHPQSLYSLRPEYTYFCELCQTFPGDEGIIVAKWSEPSLVCWAMMDPNFNEISIFNDCPFPTPQKLFRKDLDRYLENEVEGVVVKDRQTNARIKIKAEWYLRMHKLISDCTELRVWEILRDGQRLEDIDFPDEFLPQLKRWEYELRTQFEIVLRHINLLEQEYEGLSDKDLGLSDLHQPWKAYLFLRRKDKEQELYDLIWKDLHPKSGILERVPTENA